MIPISPDTASFLVSAAARFREALEHLPDSKSQFLSNSHVQDVVAFRFLLGVQDCLSAAADVVAARGIRPRGGMGALFSALGELGILESSHVVQLQIGVQFRNQLLFDFDSLGEEEIYDSIPELSEAFIEFLTILSGSRALQEM